MHPYGLIVGLALAVYFQLTKREWDKAGLVKNSFNPLFFCLTLMALFGARIYHVVDYWDYYRASLWLIPAVWNGGLGIIGALIFVFTFLFIYVKRKHMDVWQVFNIFTTHLLLAQAIGRLANLFSGDGFWQESILLLFGYLLFLLLRQVSVQAKRNPLIYYLITYGLIRIISDDFRSDLWYITTNISVSTVIALLMILSGLTLAIRRRLVV